MHMDSIIKTDNISDSTSRPSTICAFTLYKEAKKKNRPKKKDKKPKPKATFPIILHGLKIEILITENQTTASQHLALTNKYLMEHDKQRTTKRNRGRS